MATGKTARPGRTLLVLGTILLVLAGVLIGGVRFSDATFAPKLALDLEGGTQIILTPKTTDGSQISDDDINQAISIIRQRVDASGVAEAEITRQGQQNIVVALPGEPEQATLDLVRQSAQLRFRPVLMVGNPGPVTPDMLVPSEPEADASLDDGAVPEDAVPEENAEADAAPGDVAPESGSPSQQEIEEAAFAAADLDGDGILSNEPTTTPLSNSDQAWVTEQMVFDFYVLDCTDPANLAGGDTYDPADPAVACSSESTAKFALGPADLEGTQVDSATSGLRTTQLGTVTNEWIVQLGFDDEGAQVFNEVTQRLIDLPSPQNQFGIVLDGNVISAPVVNVVIPDGNAEITGNFTQDSAAILANQLSFGSLPLNFEVQSEEQISATLGIEQLERGVLAGLVGLGLVVIYMLIQYHALGFVALASLSVAALSSYLAIAILSWTTGYRLSLAGVAGLIVAIGITADSFIVYFERIRDEVREGRRLRDAVDHGWVRARRTILASDAVNFLAAAVLYFLAVGGVRGFAFTLGLTTLVDLLVVFLFTHPVMQLLIRTRFFGEGRRFSGLDPAHLGASIATYRGRGSFAPTGDRRPAKVATAVAAAAPEPGEADAGATITTPKRPKPKPEHVEVPKAEGEFAGMTIAERKAAQRERELAERELTEAGKAHASADGGA
ncbi:MAG TPA: protein translocase subunit SecD [Actinomycetaceae bacterium]|nr:protein translocase subunit SecD [Actinomycetaceae bacterium]